MTPQEWIAECYERVVATSGTDGITLKDARDRVAQAYELAIRSGEIDRPEVDLYAEGLASFDATVRPRRRARTSSFHHDMRTIVEALSGGTVLGAGDPILHVAYPLGTPDGRDKVLTFWTAEDWRNAAITRYRTSADAVASAQIFDEQATQIAAHIIRRGEAAQTGDLFLSSGESAA